jgi:L-alanine-DL-glutamate epimerase-like enolase superfamily enzyme
MVHAGVALQELDRPGQSLIDTVESTLIEDEPCLLKDGGVVPPERPGLGIEINRDALAH